ncbi:ribosome recycling factor [Candidatus Gottesmanbacteria bacterium RIFCSPHIGHO2_01_FULL_39_10]|uniref:Ribosome-recycling factor n=1 Tax=Candidatus Gottesmanbacteria bacterium RIFCSPHIGHO2_01_FULL_39_10 TaxID=1798375 RepID=A0A1F5ZQ46_9BACT|nr:MAG: ribosome recycling factor [Candidatus Gottesmanbacteria bacterium RIFCSPHIGHO2_01_FULL_39_10]
MDQEILNQTKDKMMKAINVLKEDLGTIRTGRASPALVENVVISAYDNTAHMKVKEMATITTDGPRMIVISPFDPSATRDIEKGLNAANLGLTSYIDGNLVRINIPQLTAERREEYIKLSHVKLEGGRVMIRQVRHEMMNEVKKMLDGKEISEDDKKRLDKEIQILTDEMIAEVEMLREKKEAELREI